MADVISGEITVATSENAAYARTNSRIDNIIAHNNDTEGNSELIDIRTSTNAVVYDSAGSAVRNQLSALKNQVESIYSKFFHVYNLIDIGYTMKNVAFKYGNPDDGNGLIVTGSKTIVIFPVTPGTTYYLTQLSSIYYQVALYNQNMGFISSLYSYHNNHGSWNASWSVPDSCYYVAVVIDDDYKETAFFGLQTDYAKWSDGYKYDTDSIEENSSELIDIRTGANTFIYDSAGSAVRNQLSALKNQAESIYGKFFHVYNLLDIGYSLKNVRFKYDNPDSGGGMIIGGTKQIVIIPVTPGTTYYFTQLSSIYYQIALYNKEMGFISSLYSYHNNRGSWNNSWSVPDTCFYVAVVIDNDYKDTAFWGLLPDYTKWTEGYKYDTDSIERPAKKTNNHKLTTHSSTIAASGKIELDVSDIKQNYTFSFSAKIPDSFSSVKLGHGMNALYSGMYVEVTAQEVKFYRYHSSDILVNTFTHGLDIQDFITVTVNILQDQSSEVIVTSLSGSYKCSNKWQGSKSTIAAQAIGCTLSDCSLSYYCADYDKKIWAFGDSYFYEYNSDRWPKLVIDNGFTGIMFDGYGGRTSIQALQSLNKCLDFGCPDTILWCMGMNDPDTNNSVNTDWKNTFDTLCSLCDEYKIRLVVCTIPTTSTHDHSYKNAIVRSSSLEYIDIEDALGVDENGSWYEGLLSGDNIHPTATGSKVIATKMMAALPEMFV